MVELPSGPKPRQDELETLRDTSACFGQLFEDAPLGYQSLDAEGRIILVNRAWLKLLGYARDEVTGRPFSDFLAPGQGELFCQRFPVFKQKGEVHGVEFEMVQKDKKTITVSFEGRISRNPDGSFQKTHCIITDITGKKSTEEALLERNRALSALNTFSVGLASLEPGADIRKHIAKSYREHTGAVAAWFCDYEPVNRVLTINYFDADPEKARLVREVLGRDPGEIHYPVSEEAYRGITGTVVGRRITLTEVSFGMIPENVGSVLQGLLGTDRFMGIAHVVEGRLYGTSVLAMRSGTPDPPSGLLELSAHTVAVSLRRWLSENALHVSEERFRKMFEEGPLGMALSDMQYRFLAANPVFCNILGYSAEELRRLTFRDITYPEDLTRDAENIRRLDSGELPIYRTEKRYVHKDGSVVWGRLTVSLLHDSAKNATRHLVMLEDITSRRRLDAAIKESEERFSELFETILQGVVYQEADGKITLANPAAQRILGLTLDQMQGRTSTQPEWRSIHPDGSPFPGDEHPSMVALRTGKVQMNVIMGVHNPLKTENTWINICAIPQFRPGEEKPYRVYATFDDITERKRAEATLQKSEEKYHALVDTMADVIFTLDFEGNVIDIAPSVKRITGIAKEDITGKNFTDFVHQDDLPKTQNEFLNAIQGKGHPIEIRVNHADGVPRWVSINALLIMHDGEPDNLLCVLTDIHEKRVAEQALHESEERFRALFEQAAVGIARVALDGRWLNVNHRWCDILGYTRDELLGKSFQDLTHPDDVDNNVANQRKLLTKEIQTYSTEKRYLRKDRSTVWVNLTVSLLRDATGAPKYFISVIEDITDRKLAEAKDAMQTVRLEALLELHRMMDAPEKEILDFCLEATLKIARSELSFIGLMDQKETTMTIHSWSKTAMAQCAMDDKPLHFPIADSGLWGDCVRQRKPVIVNDYDAPAESKKGCPKGHVPLRRLLSVPIFDGQRIAAVVAAANKERAYDQEDVRSLNVLLNKMWELLRRKRMEAALGRSEKRYRELVDNLSDAVVEIDSDGNIIFVSHQVKDIFGLTPEECIGRNLTEMVHPDSVSGALEALSKVQAANSMVEFEYRSVHKNGSILFGIASGKIVEGGDDIRIVGVLKDITARKHAEDALRESEEKFRNLSEQSPNMIFIHMRGRVVYANRRCEELLGYSREELYSPEFDFFRLVAPEFRNLNAERYGAHLSGRDLSPYEYAVVGKNGKRIEAILSTRRIFFGGEPAMLGMMTDISERKRSEVALKNSEQKYRELFENAQIGMYRSRIDGSAFIEVNQKLADIFGYSRDELLKTPPRIRWADPSERDRVLAILKERGGTLLNYKTRMLAKNGEIKDVETSFELHEKEGFIEGTTADITGQKRAADALRESEKRYRSLFENMQEGYAYCRMEFDKRGIPADWTYLDVNRAFGKITGLENVVGRKVTEVLPSLKANNPQLFELYGRVAKTGKPETKEINVSGLWEKAGWLNLSVFSPSKGDFAVVLTDINERKKMELALRRSLMRYELEPGRMYVVMEGSPRISLEAFRDLLNAGYDGIAVTRSTGAGSELWRQVRCAVVPLSAKAGNGALPPDAGELERWAESLAPGKAVLFDRLDYLVTGIGFKKTLLLVHRLGEIARDKGHIIFLSIDPATLEAKEVRLLEKEGRPVEPLSRESVPEDLLETMKYVYEKNIVGVRPTLASVGRDLGLSQPTVRKRMRELLQPGYIVLHAKGSGKTLELSEKGRAVFLR